MRFRTFAICGALVSAVHAAAVSGEAVYQRRCASCHDSGDSKAPPRGALKKLSVARILRSMDFGTMAGPANPMRRDERDAVAAWLGGPGNAVDIPARAFCADRSVKLPAATQPDGTAGVRRPPIPDSSPRA